MLALLAKLGAAAWPLVKWIVPWAGPRLNVMLAVVVAVGGLFLWDYVADQRAIDAAVRERDAWWERRIERARKRHDADIEAARAAADSTPAIPDTADWAERLCEQSPTCRDRR